MASGWQSQDWTLKEGKEGMSESTGGEGTARALTAVSSDSYGPILWEGGEIPLCSGWWDHGAWKRLSGGRFHSIQAVQKR